MDVRQGRDVFPSLMTKIPYIFIGLLLCIPVFAQSPVMNQEQISTRLALAATSTAVTTVPETIIEPIQTPLKSTQTPLKSTQKTPNLPISREVIEGKIDWYAEKHGVSAAALRAVIYCENKSLNPLAQSGYISATGPNGREDSWGLVQIHLPSHPNITKAQAQDVDFSLNFIAQAFAEGKQSLWSCWHP